MHTTDAGYTNIFEEAHSRVLATLISRFHDFELAEDVLQDAYISALEHWPADGVPSNPGAWLLTTARNKAIDRLRRRKKWIDDTAYEDLAREPQQDADHSPMNSTPDEADFPDERLKLIFTCCHPALSEDAQVALTLRTLGGLSTEAIAHAFLTPTAAMAQRLVRAQRKIRDAGIPYEVPDGAQLGARMAAVLATLYLIFNEGYNTRTGDAPVRRDLSAEAMRLCRLLLQLTAAKDVRTEVRFYQPELMGLLALMLLHDARHAARTDKDGRLVLLEEQDRGLWNRPQIESGQSLLMDALARRNPGPYQLQAAISAVHCEAAQPEDTDWPQIVGLYDALLTILPTPVIQLNRAAALSYAEGPAAALNTIETQQLERELGAYHYVHATRADCLRRLGLHHDARLAYERALELCDNAAEREFLSTRIASLSATPSHTSQT
jgi:RNA polymerase sigma-70 factor, ECF subfamily